MPFTSFDLSTAEFPDSGALGSFTDGALVPADASDGMVFWLPGMTRDLALWYTLVIDFEVTGDFPYTGNPRANAFSWRNDGDYGSSSTSTVGSSSGGRKELQSTVIPIGPGGDPDEERVAVFTFSGAPPVVGVRWEPMSVAAVAAETFAAPQDVAFGQVYSIDWEALSVPTAENAALSTPDVVGAVWFRLTMPVDGLLQGTGAANVDVYSGSSLGALSLAIDHLADPTEIAAGTYYARAYVTEDSPFVSFPTFVGYATETIYGPWISPSPIPVTFALGAGGTTTSDIPDTAYITAQAAAYGAGGMVTTWHTERDTNDPGVTAAPGFVPDIYAGVQGAAQFDNPHTTPPGTVSVGPVPWHVDTAHLDQGVGSGLSGYRDYSAAEARVAWFLATRIPATVVVDSLATGWQNEDGSIDTDPTGVATSGALDVNVEGVDEDDNGGPIFSGWIAEFSAVSGALLDVDGNVDWDQYASTDGATGLFSFIAGETGNHTATIDLSSEGPVYGFALVTTRGADFLGDASGVFGGVLTDGSTFVVTYALPDYRARFDGIEVLLPLFGEVRYAAPLRQHPRTDGLGASTTPRTYPRPRSVQLSNRRAGGYL